MDIFGFPFGAQQGPRAFNQMYRCFSVSMMPGPERRDADKGGKMFLPASALDQLSRLNISYPMLFKLTNLAHPSRHTHCGVLEFVAEEGKAHLPYWMMKNLLLDEGAMIRIESVSLPVATFSKFQPQSVDFLDIHDPKAVLENALRHFACLTTGDVIAIDYNDRIYEVCVLETRPGQAVSIIECDIEIDFAAPVGYQEPKRENTQHLESMEDSSMPSDDEGPPKIGLFEGQGFRLDGKTKATDAGQGADGDSSKGKSRRDRPRGAPDYNYQPGLLRFNRAPKPKPVEQEDLVASIFKAFAGTGQVLRQRPNK